MQSFYERVISLILSHGYTQSQFEAQLGLGMNSIYRWKRAYPNVNTLIKVCQKLDTSPSYLLGITKSSTSSTNLSIESMLQQLSDLNSEVTGNGKSLIFKDRNNLFKLITHYLESVNIDYSTMIKNNELPIETSKTISTTIEEESPQKTYYVYNPNGEFIAEGPAIRLSELLQVSSAAILQAVDQRTSTNCQGLLVSTTTNAYHLAQLQATFANAIRKRPEISKNKPIYVFDFTGKIIQVAKGISGLHSSRIVTPFDQLPISEAIDQKSRSSYSGLIFLTSSSQAAFIRALSNVTSSKSAQDTPVNIYVYTTTGSELGNFKSISDIQLQVSVPTIKIFKALDGKIIPTSNGYIFSSHSEKGYIDSLLNKARKSELFQLPQKKDVIYYGWNSKGELVAQHRRLSHFSNDLQVTKQAINSAYHDKRQVAGIIITDSNNPNIVVKSVIEAWKRHKHVN